MWITTKFNNHFGGHSFFLEERYSFRRRIFVLERYSFRRRLFVFSNKPKTFKVYYICG